MRESAGADRVEIVEFRHVADVIVDKGFLDAEKGIVTRLTLARIDVNDADLADIEMVDVKHRGKAEFDIGRLERRVALEQLGAEDRRLVEQQFAKAAERVVGVGASGVLRATVAIPYDTAGMIATRAGSSA